MPIRKRPFAERKLYHFRLQTGSLGRRQRPIGEWMVGGNEDMKFLKDLMVKRVVREHDVSIPDLLAGRLVHVRTLSGPTWLPC